jgi:hypothetical protein
MYDTDGKEPVSTNQGWTCRYGRQSEWNNYNDRQELSTLVDSMHDMICTIKQQAYLRYQMAAMKESGIDTVAVDFDSFDRLGDFKVNHSRNPHSAKDIFFDPPSRTRHPT